MRCPACGSILPEGARFCPTCGARAADATRHERRLLTVLFADLVGFTAASDGADPEDVRARVAPFHALVRREAARTGGTVARVLGDGVMVVWGYPVAREDDALRAVRTAIGIRDGVAALPGGLHLRAGVNSGEAVVAFGAADERADDAMGDAVNVAARLAAAAPVDGIVAGEATARLAGPALVADPLPPLDVRGKAEPVGAVLVRGLAAGWRPAVGPFLGRAAELGRLEGGLRAAADEGRVVRLLVTGEPGIGKSRLAWEARRRLLAADPRLRWLTGRCRPDVPTPGWALAEVVRAWAGIADDDPPATAAARLAAALPAGTPDRAWLLDRVGRLVGVGGAGAAPADELEAAWAAFAGLLAADGPAVLEIEDVHWADADLARFLAGPVLGGVAAPLLVLLTGRPEALGAHPSLAGPAVEALALDGLADEDALELAGAVATGLAAGAGVALDDEARRALAARSGGNPLFLGQLASLAAQRGPGAPTADSLPDTVQAVITARLDLLGPDVRAVCLDAAVVGPVFWRGALASIGGSARDDAALDLALAELVRLDLVRARRDAPLAVDVAYAFRHGLVRDTAYGMLTRADRAVRHADAAAWLAAAAGPDRADLADAVADHGLRALALAGSAGAIPEGRLDLTALRSTTRRHLALAGDHAARLDYRVAAQRYAAALDLADDDAARLDALRRLADAQHQAGRPADALATATEAGALAARLGDEAAAAELDVLAGRACNALGDGRDAELLARGIARLEALGPSAALVRACGTMASAVGWGSAGAPWVDRGIEVAEALGMDPPAALLEARGFIRGSDGNEAAQADIRRAIELHRAAGDSAGTISALVVLGLTRFALADLAGAEAHFAEAAELGRTRGMPRKAADALIHLGWALVAQGRLREAAERVPAEVEALGIERTGLAGALVAQLRFFALDGLGEADAADAVLPALVAAAADEHLRAIPGTARLVAASRGEGTPDDRRRALREAAASTPLLTTPATEDFDPEAVCEYLAVGRAAAAADAPEAIDRLLGAFSAVPPMGAVAAGHLRGLRTLAAGDPAAALPLLREAAERHEGAGARAEALHARTALAAALEALGRRGDAAAALDDVAAGWRAMGAVARAATATERRSRLAGPASR